MVSNKFNTCVWVHNVCVGAQCVCGCRCAGVHVCVCVWMWWVCGCKLLVSSWWHLTRLHAAALRHSCQQAVQSTSCMHNHVHVEVYTSPKTLTNSLKSMQLFSGRYRNIKLKQSFIVSSTHSNLCHKGLASFDQIWGKEDVKAWSDHMLCAKYIYIHTPLCAYK